MNMFSTDRKLLLTTRLAVGCLCLVLHTAPAPGQTSPPPLDSYVIGIEDVIRVSMPDHPELSAEVPVRPDGRISLPLLDEVLAAGLTPAELKQSLLEGYRSFVTVPNVSVMVTEVNSLKFYVLGEVNQPGVFDLRRPTRMLQAIAMAGGFTGFAGKDKVIVIREVDGAQERLEVHLKKVYSGDDIEANLLLRPGDTLVVP